MEGDLCYKHGGTALCYKHGGTALIYKALQPGDVTVRVPWTPQDYVCNYQGVYHVITFTATGSFVQGAGTILSQTSGGTEVVFTLRVTQGPAVFRVLTSSSTPCRGTYEDPGVTCRVLANQRGVTPKVKTGVAAPRVETGASAAATDISFDINRKLTGIV